MNNYPKAIVIPKHNPDDVFIEQDKLIRCDEPTDNIWINYDGNLRMKSFQLSDKYNWQVLTDDRGVNVLVPTLK